jgi:hypothetical protein
MNPLYQAAMQPQFAKDTRRECHCPSWARCAHFEGQAVLLMALDGIPEPHRSHAPSEFGSFWVCYFPRYDTVRFKDCPTCGIDRGLATGPWNLRPEYLYKGTNGDTALLAFEAGEALMREGAPS